MTVALKCGQSSTRCRGGAGDPCPVRTPWRLASRRNRLITLIPFACAALAAPAVAGAQIGGIQAWQVSHARHISPLAARPMTITFALAPRNAGALHAFVSGPHGALSSRQFDARYAPAPSTVRAVRMWAAAHGLSVSSVSANRLLVRITGSSHTIATALHTGFATYTAPHAGSFFQVTRNARLPAALAGHVSSVLGLSSLGRLSPPSPARPSAEGLAKTLGTAAGLLGIPGTSVSTLAYPNRYGPKDLWSIYHAPAAHTGGGQRLAIIAAGDVSQPKRDLATFEAKFGLPTVTWNQINVGTATTDTSGAGEWDLDSQYSTGFAPGVRQLNVYVGPSLSDQDVVNTINRWVTDDTSRQGSFSAGECELLAYAAGFTSSLDTVLAEAAAQGQTMFFSSGDTAPACPVIARVNGVPAGMPGVGYPASSPNGIGVGGTSVLSPIGPTEVSWYAGGGGTSLLEPIPAYQSRTRVGGVLPTLRRGVPDVSLDADPESGYQVVIAGSLTTVGGTTASAPAWQGIWARAEGAHRGALGFAGPVIYSTEPATAYHDITVGSNGFPAAPGWDYTTGLGTPDITAFVGGA